MIKKIRNSDIDNERLSKILIPIDNALKDFDFSNIVIEKPWGYEYLLYENKNASIWVLHIKHDCLTSMHCHLNKKTALILLSGEAVFTTLEQGFNLKEGDAIILDKKVFHSTQALSQEGIMLMEIETPSQKTDLLRLSDNYGRQLKGYESQDAASKNILNYNYISFNNNEYGIKKRIKNVEISLEKFSDFTLARNYFRKINNGIAIILNGRLLNDDNGYIFSIGDILDISLLNEGDHNYIIPESLEVLNIGKYGSH